VPQKKRRKQEEVSIQVEKGTPSQINEKEQPKEKKEEEREVNEDKEKVAVDKDLTSTKRAKERAGREKDQGK
jgi:hypothetical protein